VTNDSRRPPSLTDVAARVPLVAWRRSVRALNRGLGFLETTLSDGGETPLRHPPLLVVGAPRSGSTLLYQLLVERFDVGYLSNLHCRLFGAPSFVERLARGRLTPGGGTYSSVHGRTSGGRAPSECGEYWYRFFRKSPQYTPVAEADPARLRRLRAAVRALGNAAGRPLVFKNLVCSLRLGPIGNALPEAVFVFIRRDLVDNAHSLLASRLRIHGDYASWWSVEPPAVERLSGLPPHEQVVEQVRAVEAVIEADREYLGRERFLELRYEDVCDDARGAMQAVASFAAARGVPLVPRREVPERFERRTPAEIDDGLRAALVEYVRRTSPA
jgi:hypothetical protein